MTPKRLAVFLLLIASAPAWLLLRNGYGRYMLMLLILDISLASPSRISCRTIRISGYRRLW
jgi:hypothetical protein